MGTYCSQRARLPSVRLLMSPLTSSGDLTNGDTHRGRWRTVYWWMTTHHVMDSAPCRQVGRTFLRFRMGSYSLPIVLSRHTGAPRAQRLCQWCNLHALQEVHDERHLAFECPAMQCVRDRYPDLFSPAGVHVAA